MASSLFDLSALIFIAITLHWGIHLFSPLLFIALLHLSKLIHDRYDKNYHQATFVSQTKQLEKNSKDAEFDCPNHQISAVQGFNPKDLDWDNYLTDIEMEDFTGGLEIDCSNDQKIIVGDFIPEKLSLFALDLDWDNYPIDVEMVDLTGEIELDCSNYLQEYFFK